MRQTRRITWALAALLLCAGCEHRLRRPNNYPCASADQCISGVCHAELCVAESPGGLGAPCIDHGDCRSLRCVDGKCGSGGRAGGEVCRFHEECKSDRCHTDRTCEADTSVDAGPDAGRDGPRPDGPRPDGPRDKGPSQEKGKDKAAPKLEQGQPDIPQKDLKQPKEQGTTPDVVQKDTTAPPKDSTLLPDLPATPKSLKIQDYTPLKISVSKTIDALSPAVAAGNGQWLTVWQDSRDGTPNIYGSYVPLKTKPSSPFQITNTSGVTEMAPAVAYAGASFLVAWRVWSPSQIQARVVKPSATKVTTPNLTLQNKSGNTVGTPSAACGGPTCLVVWSEVSSGISRIAGAVVDASGSGSAKKAFTVNQALGNHGSPAVAYGGGRFLVVWQKTTNADGGFADQDIFGIRVSPSGALEDTQATTLANQLNRNEVTPGVAHGGGKFLVVWQDGPLYSGTSHIRAGLVDGTKTPVKPAPILVKSSSTAQHPAVTHDGNAFLVVWSELQGSTHTVILGKEVPTGGGPATSIPLAPTIMGLGSGSLEEPAVAGWGWRSLVVSQEKGNDVYGTRLSRVY